MADLGNDSMAHTAHKHRLASWITVLVLIVSSIVVGVAFVMQSVALGILGAVIGVAGVVMLVVFKVMDDAH
jgi:lipopolysaccharide export LptBFGC system permease protein LptF